MQFENRFHFVVPLWGKDFITRFFESFVPSYLSPGNLPGVACRENCSIRILTRPCDVNLLEGAPQLDRLRQVMPTRVIPLVDLDFDQHKYPVMAGCHDRGVKDAEREGAALVFLMPDNVWSDGTFRRLEVLARQGVRVVYAQGPRVAMTSFLPALRESFFDPGTGTTTIDSRSLVRLVLQHLDWAPRTLMWDSEHFGSSWPASLYWPVGHEGLLVRHFYYHPLMVVPEHLGAAVDGTIDSSTYVFKACPDWGSYHIVVDSDEMCAAEVTEPPAIEPVLQSRRACPAAIARWAVETQNPALLPFVEYSNRFHCGMDEEAWAATEARVQTIIANIRREMEWMAASKLIAQVRDVTNALTSLPQMLAEIRDLRAGVANLERSRRSIGQVLHRMREKGIVGTFKAAWSKVFSRHTQTRS